MIDFSLLFIQPVIVVNNKCEAKKLKDVEE